MKRWNNITKAQGLELLKAAPADEQPSQINPGLTRKYVTDILLALCRDGDPTDILSELLTKRIFQAAQDSLHPVQEF